MNEFNKSRIPVNHRMTCQNCFETKHRIEFKSSNGYKAVCRSCREYTGRGVETKHKIRREFTSEEKKSIEPESFMSCVTCRRSKSAALFKAHNNGHELHYKNICIECRAAKAIKATARHIKWKDADTDGDMYIKMLEKNVGKRDTYTGGHSSLGDTLKIMD